MANFYGRLQIDPSNATAPGPVSLANGVIFAGSTIRKGPIYAVEAKTGKVLWSYQTGATVYGGVSVGNGCIYLGNGYMVSVGALINPSFMLLKNHFNLMALDTIKNLNINVLWGSICVLHY
jgi:outer membrane protein assembly factor BamB